MWNVMWISSSSEIFEGVKLNWVTTPKRTGLLSPCLEDAPLLSHESQANNGTNERLSIPARM